MIKVAATPANVRKQKILDAVRDMQFSSDLYNQNFGISVDTQMAKIKGTNSIIYYTIDFVYKRRLCYVLSTF